MIAKFVVHPRIVPGRARNCSSPSPAPRSSGERAVPMQKVQKAANLAPTAAIIRLVQLSVHYSWAVILAFFLLTGLSASYFMRHVVISTDSKELMSSSLPWRQQEVMLDLAFPERINRILAVIDAATPEAADDAADALVKELSPRSDVINSIDRVDGGEFFERNGILYLDLEEVRRNAADLISAQP